MPGPLSGDVDIPKVGRLPKAAVVVGVGGVIVLIIAERRKQSKQAAAAADPYPADGTVGNPADPASTDPSTGATYGDEAAGYGGTGSGSGAFGGGVGFTGQTGNAYPWDGTYGNPNDPYSMDPSTGITYGNEGNTGGGGPASGQPAGPPFSANSQWSQFVLNYFAANNYSDLSGRTDAIGLYIGGQPVTTQQATWIHDAIAIGGQPPVAGASGFPPSIKMGSSSGTGGTGTTSGGSPPGQAPGGFSATGHAGYADFGWGTVTRATGYELSISGPQAVDEKVAGTHAEHVPLRKGAYSAKVRARNASGAGPWSASRKVTVT